MRNREDIWTSARATFVNRGMSDMQSEALLGMTSVRRDRDGLGAATASDQSYQQLRKKT